MKRKMFIGLAAVFAFVCLSYGTAGAQIVEKVKDAADKTKDVTVDAAKATGKGAKKVGVVVTDNLEKAADKTKDATVDTSKAAASKTKKFGNTAVNVTENVAGQAYEGGKYFTVTTWDGTKWVSKRVWHATKKGAGATKDAIVGDGEKKP